MSELAPEFQEQASMLMGAIQNNRNLFVAFARQRMSSHEDAEDVLQEASLKAFQNVGKLRDKSLFKPWFFKILSSAIADYGRKQKKNLFVPLTEPNQAVAPEAEENTPICRCGIHLLDELNPKYAQVIRRVLLNGESVEDTARTLRITRANLWVRLHRARSALRQKLQAHCNFQPNALVCRCACGFTECCCSTEV